MTFQQLEYIVAVDDHRHFVNAATACGVTQSTLSSTIAKLEQEIDVIIFDRSKHPIEPTTLGKKLISQARVILHNSQQLRDLVKSEKNTDRGSLFIGIIPSVSPYLYPGLARQMKMLYPHITTTITEDFAPTLIEKLQRSELDMALMANVDIQDSNLLEIELYTERFMLYTTQSTPLWQREWIRPEDLLGCDMWSLRALHDHYPQLSSYIHRENFHTTTYVHGSVDTLIRLVDINGGCTLLPELFRMALTPEQQKGLRPIQGPRFFRTISLVIRRDYLRERMLNIFADAVKHVIPEEMLSTRISKYKIQI